MLYFSRQKSMCVCALWHLLLRCVHGQLAPVLKSKLLLSSWIGPKISNSCKELGREIDPFISYACKICKYPRPFMANCRFWAWDFFALFSFAWWVIRQSAQKSLDKKMSGSKSLLAVWAITLSFLRTFETRFIGSLSSSKLPTVSQSAGVPKIFQINLTLP